ncbi:MAG: efflux RND transporter periplasmic adaptor subunit [Lachnospiraceae bacterium]|nr:efflux RND transporter periplasmic adaptor subunit [Lachnospiraceae bacterium]
MKKAIVTILILALLGGGGYGAYYYFYLGGSATTERVSSSSEDAVYVEKVSVITGYGSGMGVVDRYSGEVEAQATLEIKLDSNRTVDECYVEVGDIVEEGQALFSYETQEEEDQIVQNEIEIERKQMEIESYEAQITSYEKLIATYTDEDDILEANLQIQSMQNSIRSLEYDIQSTQVENESLQETIDESVVTAEMGGIVQKISDTEEDSDSYYYGSDSSAYITILAEGDYRIKGTINELNYDDIYEGISVIVYSRVDASQTWTGEITDISTEQDEEDSDSYYYYSSSSSDSSTYSFYVDLDSSEGLLLGQHVYIEVDSGQSEEKTGMWLEEFYIIQEGDSAYVWLANTSNVIEKHEITLGEYDEELAEYEVLDGLEADDYIAFPADSVSEGDPVYYSDIAVVSEVSDDDSDDDEEDYYDADADGEEVDPDVYYDVDEGIYYSIEEDDDVFYEEDDDEEYDDEDFYAVIEEEE